MDPTDGQDAGLDRSLVLLRDAKDGDRAALDELLTRYHDRILRVVRMQMGAKLRRHLESIDVVQQVMLTAAQRYEHFEVREESSLIYWLSRIVEREVLRQAEFHGRQRRNPDRVVPLNDQEAVPASAEHRAERAEAREELQRALDQLSARNRALIIQRDYLGASWQAIADDLGYASAEAARVSYSRAVLALGKALRSDRQGG